MFTVIDDRRGDGNRRDGECNTMAIPNPHIHSVMRRRGRKGTGGAKASLIYEMRLKRAGKMTGGEWVWCIAV